MKKIRIGILIFSVAFSLICGSCDNNDVITKQNDIFEFSKFIINSPSIKNDLYNNNFFDKDIIICAYDSYDIFENYGGEYSEKISALESLKAIRIMEIETNEKLTDAELIEATTKIEIDFDTQIQELKEKYQSALNERQNNKYLLLSEWFEKRNIYSKSNWNTEQTQIVSLTVYSVSLDDLTALQKSGLHICYTIDGLYDLKNAN